MMSATIHTPPHLDTDRLADAVTDIVIRDLDRVYAQRTLRVRHGPDGPERDATQAASSIAYLSSRLLRQIIRYYRSMTLYKEQQLAQVMEDLDDDIPW
jgi:hypothetical protein